jgi:hypothetical protein
VIAKEEDDRRQTILQLALKAFASRIKLRVRGIPSRRHVRDAPPFAGRLDHADERGFLDPDFRTAKLIKPKIFLVAVRRPVKDVRRGFPETRTE